MKEDKAKDMLSVTVYDGKYTVIQDERGGLRALRHGQEWRECTGDGLILALAQEVETLRDALREIADARAMDHKDHATTSQRLRDVQGIARAAIAKATGAKVPA